MNKTNVNIDSDHKLLKILLLISELHEKVNDFVNESVFILPPYNLEAEKYLLGALILNNANYEKVRKFLKAEHFYDEIHTHIFKAIIHLIECKQIADPITLRNYFNATEELKPVGGAQYLIDLAAEVISMDSVADYGHIIYDFYLKRKLISIGEDIIVTARTPTLELQTGIQQSKIAQQKLNDLTANKGFMNFLEALTAAISASKLEKKG